jgi:DNA-binding transcriptional ArsR family regulator
MAQRSPMHGPTAPRHALLDFFEEIEAIAALSARLIGPSPTRLGFLDIAILETLARCGGDRLAEATGLAPRLVGGRLDHLESAGLVVTGDEREPAISAEGRAMIDEIITNILPRLTALAKAVSAPDMIESLDVLRKVRAHLAETAP